MTKKKNKSKAAAVVPVRLNYWYAIDKFPTEIACQGVARCACGCGDHHVVTWLPVRWSKHHVVLAFAMASYTAIDAETPIYALSEFESIKITKIIDCITVAAKMPLLEQTMYRVPQEIAAFHSGTPDNFERILN